MKEAAAAVRRAMDPLWTSFCFGATAVAVWALPGLPGAWWLAPALVALQGFSLLNHAQWRCAEVLGAKGGRIVSVVDRTIAHGIAAGTVWEALRVGEGAGEVAALLAGYWLCLFATWALYHLRSMPLWLRGDPEWKRWHAAMHMASCGGILLLQRASAVAET